MLEGWQAVQEADWEGGTSLVSVTFSTAWPNSWRGTAAHCDCDVHTTPDGLWVTDSVNHLICSFKTGNDVHSTANEHGSASETCHYISAMGLACMVTRLIQISVVGRKVLSSTGTFSKSSRVSKPSITLE